VTRRQMNITGRWSCSCRTDILESWKWFTIVDRRRVSSLDGDEGFARRRKIEMVERRMWWLWECVDVAAKHHTDLPAVMMPQEEDEAFDIQIDRCRQILPVVNSPEQSFLFTKFLNDRTPSDSSQVYQ
jgi:hypothetical protein